MLSNCSCLIYFVDFQIEATSTTVTQPRSPCLLILQVLTTLGTFFGHVLPGDWPYSAMVLASSLGSSLLVMAVLVVIDPSVHGWMMESLSPARHRRRPFPLDRHHHHHHHRRGSTGESAEQNLAPMKIGEMSRPAAIDGIARSRCSINDGPPLSRQTTRRATASARSTRASRPRPSSRSPTAPSSST